MHAGPIVIIEDDNDDKDILEAVLLDLNPSNKIVWLENNREALQYLKEMETQPFIILSDVNLPGQTGIEFKQEIDNDPELKKKAIPFVFYSTSVDPKSVNEAYLNMTVQGYFKKKDNLDEIKNTMKLILDYWAACKHPNSKLPG